MKNVSVRFGDLESKLERICVVTGKAEKLDVLLKKRANVNDILFVSLVSPQCCYSHVMHIGRLDCTSCSVLQYACRSRPIPCETFSCRYLYSR